MAISEHQFTVQSRWAGNRGTGTSGYREYGREVEISSPGVPGLSASAARAFHGDSAKWNPELLLVAALSECQLLSYLHVAVMHGLTVVDYRDQASGVMELNRDGSGQFTSVTLRPVVTITDAGDIDLAQRLHEEAAEKCFIANSVNFPVRHEPGVAVG